VRTIRRGALVAVLLLGGACSSESAPDDAVGNCKVEPDTVCRDQDLQNVDFVAADLRGADFSGSTLSRADFRDADLTGAKLVGSILAGTNFAGANLTNVDMTGAFLFGTNFTGAEIEGIQDEGVQRCQVTEADGSYTSGALVGPEGQEEACSNTGQATTTTSRAGGGGAPRIEYFRLAKPRRCITDVAGEGIDLEWSAPNATSLTFYVDGIRIESASKEKGVKRVPFRCDGKVHIVTADAFGAGGPKASALLTVTLGATAPLSTDD
jgi:uncharacterized protein YjbI with pentapeptide repeats